MTHYIPYFAESSRPHVHFAVCGATVHAMEFYHVHSVTPKCSRCVAWLEADAKEAAALAARWDAEEDEKRRVRITNASLGKAKVSI